MPPLAADFDDLTAAAQAAASDALAVFINAARTSDDERIRLEAAKQIRDWAFGRPATQDAAPDPTQTNPDDADFNDADFWASFTDMELLDHYLAAVRELRGRGTHPSAVRNYASYRGVPLFEPLPEPQARPIVEEVSKPSAEQLHLQLDPPPEPEPAANIPAPTTMTPRLLTPGPGEILINCPGRLSVPFVGRVYTLKQGLQCVPDILAEHHIVKRFVVDDPADLIEEDRDDAA